MMISSRPISSCAAATAGAPLSAAKPSTSGPSTIATGAITTSATSVMPRKPPATRCDAAWSPASMCRTSAGTSSEENSDPARNP